MMVHDDPSEEMAGYLGRFFGDELTTFTTPTYHGRNGKKDEKLTTFVIEDTSTLPDINAGQIPLVMYGHGSWHHYTYGLTAHITKPYKKFLYCQLDYHSDDGTARKPYENNYAKRRRKPPKGALELHCAAFVKEIKHHGAKEWLYVGCDGYNRIRTRSLPQHVLNDMKGRRALKKETDNIVKMFRCKKAYLSFDLDVIHEDDICTGYGQGTIRLEDLIEVYNSIRDNKQIIGVDILGYSGSMGYTFETRTRAVGSNKRHYYKHQSILTYAILASHILGKDYHELMKLRHWIMKKHKHNTNSIDLDDLFLDIRL